VSFLAESVPAQDSSLPFKKRARIFLPTSISIAGLPDLTRESQREENDTARDVFPHCNTVTATGNDRALNERRDFKAQRARHTLLKLLKP